MTAVRLEHVTKEYTAGSSVMALDDVDLAIEIGEFVAVVGPSGSGKSTLLAIAGTLERPTSGRVSVDGSYVERLDDDALSAMRAHAIGFVFQQFFLLPNLSTLDNVANGLLYRGIGPEERRRSAMDALRAVELDHRVDHRPSELSGGERQRAAIARALVGSPALILADEPTGNVDSRQGNEIVSLLAELNAKGTTIVVVTHNPDVAAALPRTVSLRDGRVEGDSRGPR
jgi:putative ABC transport system ATP-binding protein